MSAEHAKSRRLEWLLAGVLHYGTWLASATIAVGLALSWIGPHAGAHQPAAWQNMRIVTAGVALFILLPVLRVVVMLIVFLRARDYRFGIVAGLVLVIICLGFALGLLRG
jgi:uncharacterized membrane protein